MPLKRFGMVSIRANCPDTVAINVMRINKDTKFHLNKR